ncbi:MAG: heat-inducible transcriptional repressor HrcA [Parvibaculum sp.]
MPAIRDLNERSRMILRQVVETYLETGSPVGSRFLSQNSLLPLSAATVRNVMSDLEALGLLAAPHTSAGRLPTDAGLRLFVDGLLQVGTLSDEERRAIEGQVTRNPKHNSVEDVLTDASKLLSGLSHCAALVLAPKADIALKHIEFVSVDAGRALVVLVSEDETVENRMIDVPKGLTPSALIEATNFLNARLRGRTVGEAQRIIQEEMDSQKAQLSDLTKRIVEAGLAVWSGGSESRDKGNADPLARSLIVTGQSRLLEDVNAMEDLERVRLLFQELENKADLVQLLGLAQEAEGVRLFIGSENKHFALSGSSVIVSPFMDESRRVVGVLGVIGPTRLNYARIIPMVDYTAQVVGRLLR